MSSDAWQRRAERATVLADRYSASRDILFFVSRIRSWQADTAPGIGSFQDLAGVMPSLCRLIEASGPATLAAAAPEVRESDAGALLTDYWESPGALTTHEFFARAVLELYAATLPDGIDCPWCLLAPQAGCLISQGDGQALQLVCALCFRRRSWRRTQCAFCEESSETKLPGYSTPDLEHLRVTACDSCKGYLVVIDLAGDIAAIPEVDELAALPLDLWAAQTGYRKLQPNLAGV